MFERFNFSWNNLFIILGGAIFIGVGLLLILSPELILGRDDQSSSNPMVNSTQMGMIPDTGATSQSTSTPSPSPSITATSTLTMTPTETSTPTQTSTPTYLWIPTSTRTPRPIPTRIPPTSTPIPNPTINPKLCKTNPNHPHYCTPTP
jgi:hypothetical protein